MRHIHISQLSKKFKIGYKKKQTTLARVLQLFSGRTSKKIFTAVDDISLSVESGEFVGLIGENGSGKTTLLSLIAGIFPVYSGTVETKGRVVILTSLALGFNPRLTLVENTLLAGTFMGMSRKEVRQALPVIIRFAGLEDFKHTQLYQFSKGMKVRLAVSIALHTNPDIFLADEIFSHGDADFIAKAGREVKQMVGRGASVILASHRLEVIEKYCSRVVWLEDGKVRMDGQVDEVVSAYVKARGNI